MEASSSSTGLEHRPALRAFDGKTTSKVAALHGDYAGALKSVENALAILTERSRTIRAPWPRTLALRKIKTSRRARCRMRSQSKSPVRRIRACLCYGSTKKSATVACIFKFSDCMGYETRTRVTRRNPVPEAALAGDARFYNEP